MKKIIFLSILAILSLIQAGCGKPEAEKTHIDELASAFSNVTGKGKKTIRERNAAKQLEKQFAEVEIFPDIKNIIARGKLNVGVCDDDCAPFVMRKPDGTLYGLDIDIATDLAESLGVKVNIVCLKNREDILKKLYYGELDIGLGMMTHSYDRAKFVYFSSTYVQLHQALIVSKKDLIDLNIEDNPYKYMHDHKCRIGVVDDMAYVEFAQSLFPEAEVIEYDNKQAALDALNKNEIMAVMDDSNSVALLARKHPEIALTATIYVMRNKKDNIAVAVSPTCTNLFDCISLYLESHELFLNLNDLIDMYPEVYKCE